MLDLSKYNEKNYELKWFDGQILHLKNPTQGMMMKILQVEQIESPQEQLDAMKKIMMGILQDNEEGRVFTDEEYGMLTFEVIELILEDYMNNTVEALGK